MPHRLAHSFAVAVGVLLCALSLGLLYLTVVVAWSSFGIAQPSSSGIVLGVQRELYDSGLRHVWQSDPACARFDEALVYVPREGECRFTNVEFDTLLHFDAAGRISTASRKFAGVPVAVLGDSHAMGWGVTDDATFSARLAEKLKRPVLNLAVASYGTVRELRRLLAAPAAAQADTVVIQYCENDIGENRARLQRDPRSAKEAYEQIVARPQPAFKDRLSLIGSLYKAAFHSTRYAIYRLAGHRVRAEEPLNFGGHYPALIEVLRAVPELASKRVIIFYSNGHGRAFSDFPKGPDASLPNVTFVDLGLEPSDYYRLDDHPTAAGHEKIAARLAELIAHP